MAEGESRPVRDSSRPRRRWLRFSLRALTVVVTVFGTWLGVKLGVKFNEARRQKSAVEALKNAGMHFYYEHQRDDTLPHGINPGRELIVPKWLGAVLGYDFFRTVISVQGSLPVSDDDLAHLASLPYVERLYVTGLGNNVSDAGLAHLRRPDRLIHFGASRTKIGDGFVKRLRRAAGLESLELRDSRVTDDGLLALRDLSKLKHLYLSGTKVTDAGMAALENMTALELLELDGTEISDVGLIHLKNAKRLRHLYLSRTRITDAGLAHLHGLPDLRSVALDDTATTPDGVAALKAATPTIQVFDRHGAGQLIQMERDGVPVSFFKPGPRRRAVPLRGQRSTVQNTSDADD